MPCDPLMISGVDATGRGSISFVVSGGNSNLKLALTLSVYKSAESITHQSTPPSCHSNKGSDLLHGIALCMFEGM